MKTAAQTIRVKPDTGLADKHLLIENILSRMVLAPSAHNTQPWSFAVTDGQVDVYANWDRHLYVSDPTTRQIYVSLGCAIANGLVAAAHHKFTTELSYLPDGAGKDKPAARLTFSEGEADPNLASLYRFISKRHTDRTIYDKQPLTDQEKTTLSITSNNYISLIDDRQSLSKIADITSLATTATLSRQDFKTELSHWIRNNWTKKSDGMPGFAVGMPGPISLIAPMMIKIAPIHKQEAPKSRRQIMSSSAVAIIATPTDAIPDWIKAGQLLGQLWLQAAKAGLSAMPIISSIESSDNTRNQIQHTLRADLMPQSVLRLGHGTYQDNFRPTPRHSVQDCLLSQ